MHVYIFPTASQDLLTDLAPLHNELDQLHHELGRLIDDPQLSGVTDMADALKRGRASLARVVLRERHVIATHAIEHAGCNRNAIPLTFLASKWPSNAHHASCRTPRSQAHRRL